MCVYACSTVYVEGKGHRYVCMSIVCSTVYVEGKGHWYVCMSVVLYLLR